MTQTTIQTRRKLGPTISFVRLSHSVPSFLQQSTPSLTARSRSRFGRPGRRKLLRMVNPETGTLDEPRNIKDYEEWIRTDRGKVKDEEYEGGGAGDVSIAYGGGAGGIGGASDDDE